MTLLDAWLFIQMKAEGEKLGLLLRKYREEAAFSAPIPVDQRESHTVEAPSSPSHDPLPTSRSTAVYAPLECSVSLGPAPLNRYFPPLSGALTHWLVHSLARSLTVWGTPSLTVWGTPSLTGSLIRSPGTSRCCLGHSPL